MAIGQSIGRGDNLAPAAAPGVGDLGTDDCAAAVPGPPPQSAEEHRVASFEMFLHEDPPYVRDVSEGEGIAAFALLACGQSVSRSNSGSGGAGAACGDGSAGPGRMDSASWVNLLASGGEPTSAVPRLKFPSSSSDGSRSNSSSSATSGTGSSNGADASGGPSRSLATDNDPGPMPEHIPFGGGNYSRQPFDAGPRNSRRVRPSRSRTSWERRHWSREKTTGVYDGRDVDGGGDGSRRAGAAAHPLWTPVYTAAQPGTGGGRRYQSNAPPTLRQCSFDPYEEVFGLGMATLHETPSRRPYPLAMPHTTYMPGGRSLSGSRPITVGPAGYPAGFVESHMMPAGAPAGDVAPATYSPQAWTVAPVVAAPATLHAELVPEHGSSGGSAVASPWAPTPRPTLDQNYSRTDSAASKAVDKPSFNHLKSLIPGLEALSGGWLHGPKNDSNAGDKSHGSASSFPEGRDATLPASAAHVPTIAGGGAVGTAHQPGMTLSQGRLESAVAEGTVEGLNRPFSVIDGAGVGVPAKPVTGGVGKPLTAKQVAIQRYLRKRARRPSVERARKSDPARALQNLSRERPRRRGKFVKARPDFLPITAIQAHTDGSRGVSVEIPPIPVNNVTADAASAVSAIAAATAATVSIDGCDTRGSGVPSVADGGKGKGKGKVLSETDQSYGDSDEQDEEEAEGEEEEEDEEHVHVGEDSEDSAKSNGQEQRNKRCKGGGSSRGGDSAPSSSCSR